MPHELKILGRSYKAELARRNRIIELLRDGRRKIPSLDLVLNQKWEKAKYERDRPDFLWRGAVRAVMTVRGGRFYERIEGDKTWSFEELSSLSSPKRLARFRTMAGVRSADQRNRRVDQLTANFERLCQDGILDREQSYLRELSGDHEKVSYFAARRFANRRLVGFGPKYSRNFWLDIADSEVSRERFAIDSRIQSVLAAIWQGLDSDDQKLSAVLSNEKEYRKIERELFAIAHEAGVNAWEADRVLYTVLSSAKLKRDVISWVREGGLFPALSLEPTTERGRSACR